MPQSQSTAPQYWLQVCNGIEAAESLILADDQDQMAEACVKQPLLYLPEMVGAIEWLACQQPNEDGEQACRQAALFLSRGQEALRTQQPQLWASQLHACARMLITAEEGDPLFNATRAGDIFDQIVNFFEEGTDAHARALLGGAMTRVRIAELAPGGEELLTEAVELFVSARKSLIAGPEGVAHWLEEEAHARHCLAERNRDALSNYLTCIELYQQARGLRHPEAQALTSDDLEEADTWGLAQESDACIGLARCDPSNRERHVSRARHLLSQLRLVLTGQPELIGRTWLSEGEALRILALTSLRPHERYQEAVEAFMHARAVFPAASRSAGSAILREAQTRTMLAEFGQEPAAQLQLAIELCRGIRASALGNEVDFFVRSLTCESEAFTALAENGHHPTQSLLAAVEKSQLALEVAGDRAELSQGAYESRGFAAWRLGEQGYEPFENFTKALECYKMCRQLGKPDDPANGAYLLTSACVLACLAQLGVDTQQNLLEALRLFTDAAKLPLNSALALPRCRMGEANVRKMLAELDVDRIKNLTTSRILYSHARSMLMPGMPTYGKCLINEAEVLLDLARMEIEPREHYSAALALGEQAVSLVPSNLAVLPLALLGTATARLGLAMLGEDVVENATRALDLYKTVRGHLESPSKDRAGCDLQEAHARELLATRNVNPSENLAEATRLFRSAAERFTALGDRRNAIKAYGSLGTTLLGTNNIREAREAFLSAIQCLDEIRSSILLARDQRGWMEQNAWLFRGVVDASLRLSEVAKAVEFMERGRGLALMDLLYSRDISLENHPAELVHRYQRARAEAEATPWDAWRWTARVANGDAVDSLSELRALEEQLHRLAPGILKPPEPSSYAEMRDLAQNLGLPIVQLWVGDGSSAAFVFGADGSFLHVPVPEFDRKVLWRMLYDWRSAYVPFRTQRSQESWHTWLSDTDNVLLRLYARLLHPIHALFSQQGWRRAVFCVSGALALLPLHAGCWNEGGSRRYLLEEIECSFVPSASLLARCSRAQPKASQDALVLAASPSWASLAFSVSEAVSVARKLREDPRIAECRLLTGTEVTVEEVCSQLTGVGIAHLACHAKWHADEPLYSALVLGEGRELRVETVLAEIRMEAGRLVVLAACESLPGRISGYVGEEFFGLPAAFMFAGVQTVIGSLWLVHDAASALLMQALYEHLLAGLTPGAALRKAQLWLKELDRDTAVKLLGDLFDSAGPLEANVPGDSRAGSREALDDVLQLMRTGGSQPFAHPCYWAAFQAIGSVSPVLSPS